MTEVDAAGNLALQEATGKLISDAVRLRAIGLVEFGRAARLAAVVDRGGVLSTDQAREAWRILVRNEDRLRAAGLSGPPRQGRTTHPAPVRQPEPAVTPPLLSLRSDGRIGVGHHPFALKDALKIEAHAVWDSEETIRYSTTGRKQWHTAATPAYAAALVAVLAPHGPVLSDGVRALVEEFAQRHERRSVLSPDSPLPEIDTTGLIHGALWEHQLRAVEYARRSRAALMAIPMGGGKTAATIATINLTGARRVLIVAPNKVRGVWPREVEKWTVRRWHIVDGKRPARRRGGKAQDLPVVDRLAEMERCLFDCPCDAAVHAAVINYELLGLDPIAYRNVRRPGWVPPEKLDLVVYDEVHRLKSPTGSVSKTAARWVDYFDRRIGLTGTPMSQHPWDIFGVLRALEPGLFGTVWTPFKDRYILEKKSKEGRSFPVGIEPTRVAEFTERVHAIMYAPSISLDLPGATHTIRTVELEPEARELYDALESEAVADLSGFATDGSDPELFPRKVLARKTRLRQLTGGTLPDDGEVAWNAAGRRVIKRNKYRVSRAKADELTEVLTEIGISKGDDDPVVVFCAFADDLDAVAEVAEKMGLRYREISGRRSDGLTERSELAPDADVCGVQIASGGTGVDLTRSRWGVWYSAAYSVGDHDQALKRQDRPGQTRRVRYVHLVATGTIDSDVYRAMATRRSVVDTFMARTGIPLEEGADPAPEMSMDEVAAMLNARRAAEDDGSDRARLDGVAMLPPPIDEFSRDVFGDPRGTSARTSARPDREKLAEYGLDGFL